MNEKLFCAMIDCSRNGVMKVAQVCKFIDYLSDMGYNSLMLYTEDTFLVDNEPMFGYLRGSYSQDELIEIVNYGEKSGIEVIPCIQTLAHLNAIFKWHLEYGKINDFNDILLIGEDRTYQLIENIFKTIKKCFKSKYVHIGMDEAHMVGLGKYLDKHGFTNRFELLSQHLNKVFDMAKEYEFSPIMWSDMYFRMQSNGNYYNPNIVVDDKLINQVPEEVSLVYWDYHNTNKKVYEDMLETHKKFKRDVWFAGGVWSWVGFVPGTSHTEFTLNKAMEVCKEKGIDKVIVTLWADDGKECSYFACLDSLLKAKMVYDGEDLNNFEDKFKSITGIDHQTYRLLLLPNLVCGNDNSVYHIAKMALYNDSLVGYIDSHLVHGGSQDYATHAQTLKHAGEGSYFEPIFKSQYALCEVLKYKYDLGLELREAYKSNNLDKLSSLDKRIGYCIRKLELFYKAFYDLYHWENKPYGFEIQDIRIGGLIQRLKGTRLRLKEYLNNKVESIPELEEDLVKVFEINRDIPIQNMWCPSWEKIVTVNIISHRS